MDAHFFQGRRSAQHSDPVALKGERAFDEMLSRIGVTTHYLPLKRRGTAELEKGIDVWLALEALEQSYYKHYDFVVLLAGDGDYLPLLRKLNAFGIRVMLLFWEFEYEDDKGTGTLHLDFRRLEERSHLSHGHGAGVQQPERRHPLQQRQNARRRFAKRSGRV